MKRVIKWSLIIGVIISLLGIGMITAGAMMGGGDGLPAYLKSHHYTIGWYDDYRDWDDWDSRRVEIDTSNYVSSERGIYENIRELEIKSAVGTIELVEEQRDDPQDLSIRVERLKPDGSSRQDYEIRQEREELKIYSKGNQRHWLLEDTESLIIYIPEGYRFGKVEVELNAGGFYAYAEAMYADELELHLQAGEIVIDGGEVGSLDVECAAGKVECSALVTRHADVECQAGSVEIWMAGTKEQYNYELECQMGTIILAGEEEERYTGLSQKTRLDHRASNQVELECAAGEIIVNFPDSL